MTHDTREWEEPLMHIMESYIMTAELGHLAKDQVKHKQELRAYYAELVDFIHHQLQKAREGERKRVNHILDSHIEMARDSLKNAVADQCAPYKHQLGRLLQLKTEIIDILSGKLN